MKTREHTDAVRQSILVPDIGSQKRAVNVDNVMAERKASASKDIGYSFSGDLSEEEILAKLVEMQKKVRAGYRF